MNLNKLALALLTASFPLACNSGETGSGTGTSDGESTTEASSSGTTDAQPTTEGTDASGSETAETTETTETTEGETETDTTSGSDEDLVMTPEDFTCLTQWDKVRNIRIANLLGYQAEALEVAASPTGGMYPVGTVIQLVPTEAMVKRGEGTSPGTSDWEFFFLGVSDEGTTIEARGFEDVINGFGGNCVDCHAKAEPQWDFVCEKDHGCDPLPFTDEQIAAIQEDDPRCP
ncbi:MAG: hypothetical protein ACPG77_03600 [Nannocystaceae bacterium]